MSNAWGQIFPEFEPEVPERQRPILSFEEAEQAARELADKLEPLMGEFTSEPYERSEARYEYLVSQSLSLLAKRFVIIGPEGITGRL